MALANMKQFVHIAQVAVEVHGDNGLGARCDGRFGELRVFDLAGEADGVAEASWEIIWRWVIKCSAKVLSTEGVLVSGAPIKTNWSSGFRSESSISL